MAPRQQKICFILGPTGRNGGGMGRVKDYILQSGGDRRGKVRFVAIDTRGQAGAGYSLALTAGAIARIWANALRGRVALVHVNAGDHGSFVRKGVAVVLLRMAAIPVVLHFHGGELVRDYHQAGRVLRLLISIPFRVATCCVVLGKMWHEWLTEILRIAPDKVAIVYNGVPVDRDARRVPRRNATPVRRLLFLGSLIERKGIPELFAALAGLPQDAPAWQLILAGEGDTAYWQVVARQMGIADRLQFEGWVDQNRARALLADADLLVLPSRDEALPLVILEALGMGTPVLCTPVGAIPEVLEDGETAVFVKARDSVQLSRKLDLLMKDAELREKLSCNGMALFDRMFTLRGFLQRLFDVYQSHCGVEIEMRLPPDDAEPSAIEGQARSRRMLSEPGYS